MPAMKQDSISPDVILQKQRYSRELAAYTFQQWEMARQALERTSRSQTSGKSNSRRSTPSPRDTGRAARSSPGIQSIDYARKSLKPTSAISHESRAIDLSVA